MDLTIKQLASKLKISRPTVEVRMNHVPDFRKKYTKKQGNKIMINDEGCQLISKTKAAPHHNHHNNSQVSNHRDKEIVLKVFHDRALEQSNMIKSQDQTIKKLTKLLDQQQQLQLSTEAENKTLKHRVKTLTHANVSTKDTKDNVLAFNNKNLSSIGKITKPEDKKKKSTKQDTQAQQKAKQDQAKANKKAKKKSRHKKFWQRFFGK